MNQISQKIKFIQSDYAVLLAMSLFTLLIHLYTNAFASYGYFRDELYYIACSNRIGMGYVDQPPLSIYVLALSRWLFGDSLFAIRLFPAIASSVTVFITGLMARRLGGRKLAVAIACLAVIAAPIFLAMNTVYSMNCFDMLLWALASYLVMLIVRENNPRIWILLGIVLGLGLLNKVGFLWFGLGLFGGLLLTQNRKHLLTIWPCTTALIALAIFSPFVIWNFNHNFAHLEFIRNALASKYSSLTRLDFIFGQVQLLNPASILICLAGLYYYFLHKQGKLYRILGIIYLTAFLILLINGQSKAEYLAPAYPPLFAAGSIVIENITRLRYWRWFKYAVVIPLIITGILISPVVLPILPVEIYIRYADVLGIAPHTSENKELAKLPQYYADMFGWETMAKEVSKAYQSLPAEYQASTVVFAQNYGEAGALEFYSKKYRLPRVVCPHNSYWIWGYGNKEFQKIIVLGDWDGNLRKLFKRVHQVALHTCVYCMPYENNLPIFICEEIIWPINFIWKVIKNYS